MFKLFIQRLIFSLILCAASLVMAAFNILAFLIVFILVFPIIIIVNFGVIGKAEFKKWYFTLMFSYDSIIEFIWENIINSSLKILNNQDKQTFLN